MSKTIFTSPEQMVDLQGRMMAAVLEAAEESAVRFEKAAIENMTAAAKLRAKTAQIAREAMGLASAPAAK
jgi:hypothetical protein